VRQQWSEGEAQPGILAVDDYKEKLTARLQHPRGFRNRLLYSVRTQVVHRVGTDDPIERRIPKRQPAHVPFDDRCPLFHASSPQVGEQPLLRTLSVTEVRLEGLAE
jgi:hypothetical protein